MLAISIGFLTFVLTFSAAWAGMVIRSRLPEEHKSKESQDVVRLGMGLIATMTALLLGLVTAAAKNTFDTQDRAIRESAVSIMVLDRHLARYGPETARIRDHVRSALENRLQAIWPTNGGRRSQLRPQTQQVAEDIQTEILTLAPQTEEQRWFRSEAIKLTDDVVRARLSLVSGRSGAVPHALLVVVIFWLMATFASFGLYAPRNGTVLAVLLIVALSVAAAVFLILELDGPLEDFIKVSATPLRYALDHIGR